MLPLKCFCPVLVHLTLCTVVFSLTVSAQVQTTTDINGIVSDQTGAVIVGAKVAITDQDTGAKRATTTNNSGYYAFPSLPPGTYTVLVSHHGFKNSNTKNLTANTAQPARLNITLQVGASAETVTVSAEGEDLISTTTSDISGTINSEMIKQLPSSSGNFFDLAALTPGSGRQDAMSMANNNGSGQISFGQSALVRVNAGNTAVNSGIFAAGNRDSAANVSIDGSNVQSAVFQHSTQLQSTSTIAEVKIQSGTMNAEFGFGATAVNVITKNGTNQFHGEVYELLRNDNLDAALFFANLSRTRKPEYKQNQFGASLGGPILRNKLLFFANYEGRRVNQSSFQQLSVPPMNVRSGDFSQVMRGNNAAGIPLATPTIYNPYQFNPATGIRMPFPGNKIPMGPTSLCAPRPTCVDPVSLAMLKYTPEPNLVLDNNSYLVGTPLTLIGTDQGTIRFDWEKSSAARIFARYTHFQTEQFRKDLMPLNGQKNPYGSENGVISWTHVMSSAAVNVLSLSYSRPTWGDMRNLSVGDVSAEVGLKNTSNFAGAPSLTVPDWNVSSGYYIVSDSTQHTYQFKDDYSQTRGRHSLKFGFQLNERRLSLAVLQQDKGGVVFRNVFTQACPAGNAVCTAAMRAAGMDAGGLGFADFLLGAAYSTALNIPGSVWHGNQRYYGFYAQDSWQLHRRLTINMGLRYEYWSPWLNPRNMTSNFNKYTGVLAYSLKNPMDYLSAATHWGRDAELNPGVSRAGYRTGNKDFAPRLGLAYQLTRNTTVRLGTGIFFDGNANGNQMSQISGQRNGPFGFTLANGIGGNEQLPALVLSEQFPAAPNTPVALPNPAVPPALQALSAEPYWTPTIYEWSLSIQRRIGKALVAEISYFGSHTIRQIQNLNLNPANLPQGDLAKVPLNQRRVFPGWGAVNSWAPVGFAKYNAVTTTVRSPSWHGLTLMSFFTWSKDKVSSAAGRSDYGNVDWRSYDIWAGPSLQNPALRNVNSWSYQLPFGRGRSVKLPKAADYVAGGWSVSGILELSQGGHQGFWSTDTSGTSSGQTLSNIAPGCDPNYVPGGRNRYRWINVACYSDPPFGTWGNSTIGSFIQPGINNWNISMQKQFIVKRETNRIAVRADLFNAFNHTQFGFVQNLATAALPGSVNGTRPARQIQLSMRYMF